MPIGQFVKGEKKREYVPFEMDQNYEVDQGDVTYIPEVDTTRGKDAAWIFSNPVHVGDEVTISENSTRDRIIFKKAGAGDEIYGKVYTRPEWSNKEGAKRPRENKAQGTYQNKFSTIRLYGDAVDEFRLADTHAAITAGDSIVLTDDGWDKKASGKNSTRCLCSIDELKKGSVPAIRGFHGDFGE